MPKAFMLKWTNPMAVCRLHEKDDTEERETCTPVLGAKAADAELVHPKDTTKTKVVPLNDWMTLRFDPG